MKFTIKDLRRVVDAATRYQLQSGSPYYYVEQGRNGYQAVDLYSITGDGREGCHGMIAGGTSREVADAVHLSKRGYYGYTYPQKANGLTRAQALTAVRLFGLDIRQDFHALDSDAVDLLVTWAKATRYRKPKNANGSTARYFWTNLQRLAARS
jgi:hypothetical protein